MSVNTGQEEDGPLCVDTCQGKSKVIFQDYVQPFINKLTDQINIYIYIYIKYVCG